MESSELDHGSSARERNEDLTDLSLALARILTTDESRHSLDEVLQRLGYTREELEESSE